MRPIVVFLFYLALAVVFTSPLSLGPFDRAANDGDPLHISWILAWDAHQAVRDPLHLFDSNTFYPYPSSLAFSEHMIGIALFSAPFYYATGNALFAQNVMVLFAFALSATGMFLLVRELTGRPDAAVVAGMIYAFHTYSFHEVPRLQLLTAQWFPFALLFLHRAYAEGGRKNAWLFALFFTLQGLACTYYLFYFALVLALWIPVYTLVGTGGWKRTRSLVAPLAVSGALFGVLAIPYMHMLRSFDYQRGLAEGLDLMEYLRPPNGSLLSSWIRIEFPPSVVPQYLGMFTLLLAAAGLWTRFGIEDRMKRALFWLSAATALVAVVLSLGPTVRVAGRDIGTGPYYVLYEYVPFFRVLRNAERMSVLVHLGLAAVAGVGASALFTRLSDGALALRLARIGLLVLLPYEHFSGGRFYAEVPTGSDVPEVYRWLNETPPDDPVVELPVYPREQLRRHALYVFYSTYHFRPIVFGRTSFYPPLTSYLAWELRDFPDADEIGLLEGLGVERVVVHPNQWPPEERAEALGELRAFADRLEPEARFPPSDGRANRPYGFGDERVYRVRRAGRVPSTEGLCSPEDEIDPSEWTLRGDAKTPHDFAVDRDPDTKWRTDRQLPGLKLRVDLGREETIAAVRLTLSYPFDEFPRDLTLKARGADGRFERVDVTHDLATKWELVEALLHRPSEAAITLRFEPIHTRRLRFWVREGKSFDYALPDWAMPELHVYRSCR